MNIEKATVAQRFGRSAASYDECTDIQRDIASQLAALALPFIPTGATIFEVGCGTGHLTFPLLLNSHCLRYIANDISQEMLTALLSKSNVTNCLSTVHGDAETMSWPKDVDVVASASAVQWFAKPLSFVTKAGSVLKCGNVLCFSTFGSNTFTELREAGAIGLSYPHFDDWERALTVDFDVKKKLTVTKTRYYDSLNSLFHSIKTSGVNALSERMPVGRMRSLMRHLNSQLSRYKVIKLTYEAFLFVAVRR